jgi:L-lactate dehydrogenase complex protein LldF
MVDSIPEIQIAVVGIDRIVPNLESLDVMMSLLPRSAVGAKITSYFTIDKGPRRPGETDGPREAHIILVDNGRHDLLGTPFQEMMRCMRCGACLNTCPVYRHITGHGYGSIYPGPMGIVLTPALEGYEAAGQLPYACTLCGACDDVCPSKIPLHSLVHEHRVNIVRGGYNSPIERTIYRGAAQMMGHMPLYRLGTAKVAAYGMKTLSVGHDMMGTQVNWMPVVKGWTESRDIDLMKTRQFRDWFSKTRGLSSNREYITVPQDTDSEGSDA